MRGLRLAHDWTLLDVAARMAPIMGDNVDPSYVQKIEKGAIKTSPSTRHVYALLDVLGGSSVVVRWLFGQPEASPAAGEEVGRRHAQYRAGDVTWISGLTPEEQARLQALFAAEEAAGL